MFLRFYLIIILLLHFPEASTGQRLFYQETCYCGVTGAGFSTAMGAGSGSFDIYIEPGSTIKKAYLFGVYFGNESGLKPPTDIQINSNIFRFDSTNFTGVNFQAFGNYLEKYLSIHAIDVTTAIAPNISNYSITIPIQNYQCTPCKFDCIYLHVIYENPLFTSPTASYVLLNSLNENFEVNYSVNNINPATINAPIGFATYLDRLGGFVSNDGSYLYFNNGVWQNVGLLEGGDNVNSSWDGAGVKGHYYYQNEILFGLDDDTPDDIVGGTDGLIDVKDHLNGNSLQWRLQWELPSSTGRFNIYNGFFLSHSTPCDTFSVSVPNDTTICSGESLSLNVLGGQTYEWSALSSSSAALADLSCTDCPNPVFSGDTSRFYTVRIRNNDSCSVVRPIKINVRPKPTIASLNIQPSECGTASGSILMNVSAGTNTPISYTLNGSSQSSSIFNGLTSGSYTLSFTDGNGCQSKDSVVFIPEVITTIADFSMSPDHGVSPLIVSIINESINATDYAWSVNGSTYGSSMSAFTFDTSGVYTIELIAWQSDTSCSDTFSVSIVVIDSLIIPTIITPNQDGKNDEWILQNVDQLFPDNEVIIFNRWGSIVFESEKGKYEIKPWDGTHKGKELPMGTYFYIIRTALSQELRGYISLIR